MPQGHTDNDELGATFRVDDATSAAAGATFRAAGATFRDSGGGAIYGATVEDGQCTPAVCCGSVANDASGEANDEFGDPEEGQRAARRKFLARGNASVNDTRTSTADMHQIRASAIDGGSRISVFAHAGAPESRRTAILREDDDDERGNALTYTGLH